MNYDRTDLAPLQLDILDQLFSLELSRPTYAPELAKDLGADVERDLKPMLDALDWKDDLFVSKRKLFEIHACEGLYRATSKDRAFEWSVPTARGTVVHKAVEVSIQSRGMIPPITLVDKAVERIATDESEYTPGRFIRGLEPFELAELKAAATNSVTRFLSDFPPIDPSWFPMVESKVGADLFDGRIRLQAKCDISFGRPRSNRAQVIIVDFKTGGQYQRYSEDLRYYALLQTLRDGLPPFRVASYFLDSGKVAVDDVDEDVLESARRHLVDGVRKMVDILAAVRQPVLTPGVGCRFCPALKDCPDGTAYRSKVQTDDQTLD